MLCVQMQVQVLPVAMAIMLVWRYVVKYHGEYIIYYHRIHFYYNTSHSIAHYLHIIFKHNIFTCHNIIAFCFIVIARMAKPASKTKKTIQTRLGSLTKAGTKGKKRSVSSQYIAPPISNRISVIVMSGSSKISGIDWRSSTLLLFIADQRSNVFQWCH